MNISSEVYDIEKGLHLAGGNHKLAIELIDMLIAQLPEQKIEIAVSVDKNDKAALKQHIHKLHGSSQCCATPALINITREFENIIDNNLSDQFEALKTKLFIEIDKVLHVDTSLLTDQIDV